MFLCQLIIVAAAMGQATQSTGAEGPRGPVIRVSLTDDMINDPLAQGLRVRPRTEVREHGDSPRAATTQPSAGMAPTTRPATNTPTTQPVSAEPNRGSASPVAPRMTVAARPALMDMENDLLTGFPSGIRKVFKSRPLVPSRTWAS